MTAADPAAFMTLTTPLPRLLVAALAPLALLLLALGIAGLAAPGLHHLSQSSISMGTLVGRGALLLIALAAWLGFRHAGLGRGNLGLPAPGAPTVPPVMVGLLAGVAILGVLSLALLWLEIRVPNDASLARPWYLILRSAGKALLTGAIVAMIEEPLFRGALLGGLVRHVGTGAGIVISAFYYALPHFLRTGLKIPADIVEWNSGLVLAVDALSHLLDLRHADSFLALWLAGIFLALVRLGGNLFLCIGLHAGWVFVLRFTNSLTRIDSDSALRDWVGGYDGIIGGLASVWLALLCAAAWFWIRRSSALEPLR